MRAQDFPTVVNRLFIDTEARPQDSDHLCQDPTVAALSSAFPRAAAGSLGKSLHTFPSPQAAGSPG